MPALNSLVAQPGNAEPPQTQGTDSRQPSGLQGLMGQGGGQALQPPSYQETVALLHHMSAFKQRWATMLRDPEIGTKNMRSDIQDMMADMMSDDYASLPEVMGALKSIPTDPLQQKQWIEKNIQNDDQAMKTVLDHYAQGAPPPGPWQAEMAKTATVNKDNRSALVKQAMGRYNAHVKNARAQRSQSRGIPVA